MGADDDIQFTIANKLLKATLSGLVDTTDE